MLKRDINNDKRVSAVFIADSLDDLDNLPQYITLSKSIRNVFSGRSWPMSKPLRPARSKKAVEPCSIISSKNPSFLKKMYSHIVMLGFGLFKEIRSPCYG